jgi:signal transduction histidine kinase
MTDRTARVAAPLALALFVAAGFFFGRQPPAVAVPAALVAVAVAVVLAVRATTGRALLAGVAVAGAAATVVSWGVASNLGWFALFILVAWCALGAGLAEAFLLTAGVVIVAAVQWVLYPADLGWGAWIAGALFTAVLGVLVRRQQDLLERLRTAQAGLAESARLEERTRIAREIHDVVGHALTVSLLHVTSARLALDEDPAEARASLEEAERLGRRSLTEVRQAVGVLRDGEPRSLAPMPGAGQLDELAESFRHAGTPVRLEVTGDPAALTATGGLTVYRILQEALTNVARHAPRSPAEVRVEIADGGVRLSVENPVADPGAGAEAGSGILGMRERAESLGGTLTAGPSAAGWHVEAVLPNTLIPEVERIA